MAALAPEHRSLVQEALDQVRRAGLRLDAADAADAAAREPIAIVGMGLRLPWDIVDADTAWSALRAGTDGVGTRSTAADGTRSAGDESGTPAGLLRDVAGFDADFFGISAAEAARMDPQQRLTLQVAWEALEDAGIPIEAARDRTTGVYIGVYNADYLMLQLADPAGIDAYTASGSAHSILANRLSYQFDLHGPSLAVDTACSSSLTAVHLAVQALRAGDCDLALVGGVNVIASPHSDLLTGKVLPFATTGRCRSFDADADGIVRGEGAAILVLERAGTAAAAGHRVWTQIRGTAINQDGRTNGLTAPNPRRQRDVMTRALAAGGVSADRIVYVEAHGTGTPLGDPIEMEALRDVYGDGDQPCFVGSIKAQTGHLEAASGVAGVIKAALVLQHGEVPGQLHLDRLNPEIDLTGSRLTVPRGPAALPVGEGPRFAAVSSFGFGGANAHVVLQEAPPVAAPGPARPQPASYLLALSARDPDTLDDLAAGYRRLLVGADPHQATAICAAAALRRTHHNHRRAVAADSPEQLGAELAGNGPVGAPAGGRPRIVFVFSGQGAQWPAMTAGLAGDPYLAAELQACEDLVQDLAGWSLRDAIAAGRLDETAVAQVAIAAVQLGLARRLAAYGVVPDAVLGHSMGELVAACVAGALSRADLIQVLLTRAALAERTRGGRMASIALPAGEVAALLGDDRDVGIAAVNAPGSTVVAGTAEAVGRVLAKTTTLGVRARMLPVDYAFHSPLLAGADDELTRRLADLPARTPQLPLLSTVTGTAQNEPMDARYWGRNLCAPVRFADAVAALPAHPPSVLVEIGPHPVLLGDLQRIREGTDRTGLRLLPTLRRDRDPALCLDETLAGLYEAGADLGWDARYDRPAGHVALPRQPWRRPAYWSAPQPGRPQPAVVHPRPRPGDRTPVPVRELTDAIRTRVAAVLELETIDADRPLQDYELESIMVVQLRNDIERQFGLTVPLDLLLAGGSPAAVAHALHTTQHPAGAAPLVRVDAQRMLAGLDQMTSDEIEAAIAAIGGKQN